MAKRSRWMSLGMLGAVVVVLAAGPVWGQSPAPAEPTSKEVKATVGKEAVPASGTAEEALLEGLKLIEAGNFTTWVSKYCHSGELCRTKQATKSLLTYNLPSAKRIISACIRGASRDSLKITRHQATSVEGRSFKIFVECNPDGMPRPFHLEKQDGAWKFSKI